MKWTTLCTILPLLALPVASYPQRSAMLAAAPIAVPGEAYLKSGFASASVDAPAATLHVVSGHSLVLHTTRPMKRVYIGNPDLLQSFTSSPTEVVLTAKAPGTSTVVLWDTTDQSLSILHQLRARRCKPASCVAERVSGGGLWVGNARRPHLSHRICADRRHARRDRQDCPELQQRHRQWHTRGRGAR